MSIAALWTLIRRDLVRARGALVTSGFGIAAGTAALVFFLALGLGVRAVLLGEVFPIDQVEFEPPAGEDPGLLMGLLMGADTPVVTEEQITKLKAQPGVQAVYPKLRFAFPGKAGAEVMGKPVGASELIGDGVDPELVKGDVYDDRVFEDPLNHPGKACTESEECGDENLYCERASGAKEGVCSGPVPVLISPYMIEIFDKSIAPAHDRPPMGKSLANVARDVVGYMVIGESVRGKAKNGEPRKVLVRLAGVSSKAIDLGVTLPIDVVRRWNEEYGNEDAGKAYSSVLVKTNDKDDVADVVAYAETMDLTAKDQRARDVSVLVTGVFGLLALVAVVILIVSASNIAYTFRVFVNDRQREIALYRAVGASAVDMVKWMLGLALTVGVAGGAIGLGIAYGASRLCNRLAATKLPDFPFKPDEFFAFPPWLLALAVGFASLFALLGAFGPARRAGKVDPSAALAAL